MPDQLLYSGMKFSRIILIIAFSLPLASCLKEKALDPSGCSGTVSYANDIVPIINTSCITGTGPGTGCHDAWITEYDNIPGYMANGSWYEEVITAKTMPIVPNAFGIDELTGEEVEMMRCWIEQGYPNN